MTAGWLGFPAVMVQRILLTIARVLQRRMAHVEVTKTAALPQRKPLLDLLFGRPLASEEESAEQVGPAAGVPIFGLDALSSAAYGPEAALTILIPMGIAGLDHIVPISLIIIVLLSIVYFSYRQTIEAYPTGGGSYTVASENLGAKVGLLAGAALMIDYILNVAVGISAGVGAIVSALPKLQPYTLPLCLGILIVLTIVNLRGVREAGVAFMIPTYLFIACLLGMVVVGLFHVMTYGGHPVPVIAPPKVKSAVEGISLWLLLKAFASGCTALTGVEAVSNGVKAFREPRTKSAQNTLTMIIAILIMLLAGIAYLVRVYHIAATEPGRPGYQSILSQLTAAVEGRGVLYFVTHHLYPLRLVALSEHILCRLPTAVPCDCGKGLPSLPIQPAGAAPDVLVRSLCACILFRYPSHRL
jgi:hypothetical protein